MVSGLLARLAVLNLRLCLNKALNQFAVLVRYRANALFFLVHGSHFFVELRNFALVFCRLLHLGQIDRRLDVAQSPHMLLVRSESVKLSAIVGLVLTCGGSELVRG